MRAEGGDSGSELSHSSRRTHAQPRAHLHHTGYRTTSGNYKMYIRIKHTPKTLVCMTSLEHYTAVTPLELA